MKSFLPKLRQLSFDTLTSISTFRQFHHHHHRGIHSISCGPGTTVSTFSCIPRGVPFTHDFRLYFRNDTCGSIVSPLHDVPLHITEFKDIQNNVYHMIVEIPRWTNAKMEICRGEILNPIRQTMNRGKVRFVSNIFPHHGHIWNYGSFPQTWENPMVIEESTKLGGDNDPLDVLEVGGRVHPYGAVLQVKVLGCLGIIDEGESSMDWKILVVDCSDPMAPKLKDVGDIEKRMPGYLDATIEWFTKYKIPQGKAENSVAFGGQPKSAEFAVKLLEKSHLQWKKLSKKEVENNTGISLERTMDHDFDSCFRIGADEALKIIQEKAPSKEGKPEAVDPFAHKWHFIAK